MDHHDVDGPHLWSCISENMYIIGVDIGASHIGAGLVFKPEASCAEAALQHVLSCPLDNKDPQVVIEQIISLVDQLKRIAPESSVSAIGVGCPGQVVKGTIVGASNLGWKNVPLQHELERHTRLKVVVLNDADAAICAECWMNPTSNISNAALLSKSDIFTLQLTRCSKQTALCLE